MSEYEKPTILYVFDPLCGWCFGFSKTVVNIFETFKNKAHFEVLSGGLILGDRVGTFAKTYPQIVESIQRVEDLTGTHFGEGFKSGLGADLEGYHLDSYPPTRAFAILKAARPDIQVIIAHEIQDLFYVEGKDLNIPETYRGLCEAIGVDYSQFLEAFDSDSSKHAAEQNFTMSYKIGIRSYPTLVWIHGEKGELLAQGYRSEPEIVEILQDFLTKLN